MSHGPWHMGAAYNVPTTGTGQHSATSDHRAEREMELQCETYSKGGESFPLLHFRSSQERFLEILLESRLRTGWVLGALAASSAIPGATPELESLDDAPGIL